MASEFSEIMRRELIRKEVLIDDSLRFVHENNRFYRMHIISGSDQDELRYLCKRIGIDQYFKTIEGSPTPKNELVPNLISKFGYTPSETILIGDSINDYEAAAACDVEFFGYNNDLLKGKGAGYLTSFS